MFTFTGTMMRFLAIASISGLLIACSAIATLVSINNQLPSVESMKDIRLQTPLRIFTIDGKLIGQFGQKRRIPVKLAEVPPLLIKAFIATEDRRFYDHAGVDFRALMRAAFHDLSDGTLSQGGGTITMQLGRNMFLSPQKTFRRKIDEILLALKIEKSFSKKDILEVYLNKIYMGHHAYGVAGAASVYYGKKLDELTLAEMATIAGLPKAPSALNPISNPDRALERRSHVLESMLSEKFITQAEYVAAMKAPIAASYHPPQIEVQAPYVAEMVRQTLFNRLGEEAYTTGLKVYMTLDSNSQLAANTPYAIDHICNDAGEVIEYAALSFAR